MRFGAAAPGDPQPAKKCYQVHRTGRRRIARGSRGGARTESYAALFREGHRNRNPAREADLYFREVRTSRRIPDAPVWRHGDGAHDLAAAAQTDEWTSVG